MKNASVDYTTFWSFVTSKALLPQFIEGGDQYSIFAIEGNVSWETIVAKDGGANQTDFETNYKSTCNKPLEIKAGAGRPLRVAASPQPINTIQRFKGYQISIPALSTSATLDISFPSDVYVRGGTCYLSNGAASTDSTMSISCDVQLVANSMTVVAGLIDSVYVPDQPAKLDFISPESMYLASELKFHFTINITSGSLAAQKLNIIIEYYQ